MELKLKNTDSLLVWEWTQWREPLCTIIVAKPGSPKIRQKKTHEQITKRLTGYTPIGVAGEKPDEKH